MRSIWNNFQVTTPRVCSDNALECKTHKLCTVVMLWNNTVLNNTNIPWSIVSTISKIAPYITVFSKCLVLRALVHMGCGTMATATYNWYRSISTNCHTPSSTNQIHKEMTHCAQPDWLFTNPNCGHFMGPCHLPAQQSENYAHVHHCTNCKLQQACRRPSPHSTL